MLTSSSCKVFLVYILLLFFCVDSNSQILTNVYVSQKDNLSKIFSKENRRYIISNNLNLRNKDITIGANSILDFQGGSISNGTLTGNKTLVIGAPYCIFDAIQLHGSFKGEAYPEWFNGDVQNCVDHFKVIKFVDEEYILQKPLNLNFGCKLEGASFNVLRFNLSDEYYGKGCINVGAHCEVSNFIIYVVSDNPAIEIKSGYVSASMTNSDYLQRIAPETTSPGAGSSAAINIHDLTVRTALAEKKEDKVSSVYSTMPAIWLAGGGGYAAYDRDAHMHRIIKAPGMWGIKFSNIDIAGRWLVGIKCEQVNEVINDNLINELEIVSNNHNPIYSYWESHNKNILSSLKKEHKWGYGWITGCTFDNIKIHAAMGGIWLGREHNTDGYIISRGSSIQHFLFSNVQMQYWQRTNNDNTINIGSQYFVKLNNCNGITFTNCEPWDWPVTTKGVEKPFQIDDSYNVWNVTIQGYSQWNSTTTNFIQYENGRATPLCDEHRVVSSIPEASFGMGNIAILDDYVDYTHYSKANPESMSCNRQLRLLPPGTYSIPNLSSTILKEFFKVEKGLDSLTDKKLTDSWLEVKLVSDEKSSIGTQYKRIIILHYYYGRELYHVTMHSGDLAERALRVDDWD